MRIDSNVVNLDIKVELDWYRLGHEFATENSDDQYQFFNGLIDELINWEYVEIMMQTQYIADELNKKRSDTNKILKTFLDSLSERLEC